MGSAELAESAEKSVGRFRGRDPRSHKLAGVDARGKERVTGRSGIPGIRDSREPRRPGTTDEKTKFCWGNESPGGGRERERRRFTQDGLVRVGAACEIGFRGPALNCEAFSGVILTSRNKDISVLSKK